MKTKEEIIAVIEKIKSLNIALSVADYEVVLHYLKLSTLNPNKIDEERMATCFEEVFTKDIYAKSNFKTIVDKYNSTCKDHQVLQPLPDEMPDEFKLNYSLMTAPYTWNWLVKTYSSPTKKELVSVDELEKEFLSIVRSLPLVGGAFHISLLAQHIIDTYSLNPPKREWWMDLKEGEKFKDGKGGVFIFDGMFYIGSDGVYSHPANKSTPYIEPTIFDKLKAKGVTDDEINELINQHEKQEFMKEVKG